MSANKEMISTMKALGYSAIGLSTKIETTEIDIVSRLDIDPKNPNELLRSLRSNRWKNELITVNCRTKSVARQAGKDHRVDMITFPLNENWRNNHLDKQQASLMRESGCGYLIDVSQLFTNDPQELRKRIEYLKRDTENASKGDIPVTASTCSYDKWGLRDLYSLAALLNLLHIDEDHALDMISSIPYNIVDANREKLKDSYIASGVWVIE